MICCATWLLCVFSFCPLKCDCRCKLCFTWITVATDIVPRAKWLERNNWLNNINWIWYYSYCCCVVAVVTFVAFSTDVSLESIKMKLIETGTIWNGAFRFQVMNVLLESIRELFYIHIKTRRDFKWLQTLMNRYMPSETNI